MGDQRAQVGVQCFPLGFTADRMENGACPLV